MIPLHHEPHFTFRFADNRVIPAFTSKALMPGGGSPSSDSIP